ncbi:MAG TPA: alpha/beta fold hydrolase [Vicinamibacteria bacterium]|nr:alpha/beta fold hydrolase [Vicinamibacteria bacterium]
MPTAKIAGTDLAYDVRGDGPALLLLHAFPLRLAMWDDQARALSSSFRVVRFDCRGFGATPPGDGLLTMERIADDAAALLDHLDVGAATVGGLSMGGYAAFAFVRRHPSRLRALVLADTKPAADSDAARRTRAEQAETVRREGSAALADAVLGKLVGRTTHESRPGVLARVKDMILAGTPRGITDALAGLAARGDSTPTLREIRVPTLVVCGEEDVITPPAEAEAMHHAIGGSTLELVPGAGHLANLEAPEHFNRALSSFLRRVG